MDATYRIRPAVMADIERIVALERKIETLPHWPVANYLGALPPVEHGTRSSGTRRCFFVLCAGELVVGFAVGRVTAFEAAVLAELESVGVADAARRKGGGRELCRRVIGWARGKGATGIELEVRSKSDGAIELYRGLGFVVTGMRGKYYRAPEDDALMMRLELAATSGESANADSLRE